MLLKVYDKTTLFGEKIVACVYPVEEVICIKHYTYGEMCKRGDTDLTGYKRTETFMELSLKRDNGECAYATFPTSKWDMEFTTEVPDQSTHILGLSSK